MLVALPLLLLVVGGFNMRLFFQEKAPFVVATAAGSDAMCMADGNATRVAAHVVAGTRARVPRIKFANARTDVLAGGHAQKVHVPFWKICAPALLLPVQVLIQGFVHTCIPPSVTVGITGFLVLGLHAFGGLIPGWMLSLFGYRVGLGKNKQRAWFPKFYISLLVTLFGVVGVVQGVAIPDCAYDSDARTCGIRKAVDDYIAGSTGSYGPIEDWDTSLVTDMSATFQGKSSFNADISKWITGAVTTMEDSKCTLSFPLCGHAFRCCICEYTTTRVSSDPNSHTFCSFCFCISNGTFVVVVVVWSFFSLMDPLLQCLRLHLSSIRTCPNGIRWR